jgi:small-conductance mechanosensitive channel
MRKPPRRPGDWARGLAAAARAVLLAACLWAGPAPAADPLAAETADARALLDGWNAAADKGAALIAGEPVDEDLRTLRETMETSRSEARVFLAAQRRRVEQLRRQLDALGPPPAEGLAEEASVAELRRSLTAQVAAEDGVLSAAQLAETRFTQTLEALAALSRDRLRTRLLTRGETPLSPVTWWSAGGDLARAGVEIAAQARAALADPARRATALERAPVAALAVAAALGLLFVAQRRVGAWTQAAAGAAGRSRVALIGIGTAALLARLVMPLAALVLAGWGLRESGLLGPGARAALQGLGLGLLWVVGAYALSSAYFAPETPALRLSALDDKGARRGRRAVMAMAVVLAADSAIEGLAPAARLDERTLVAANFLLVLAGAVALWRLKRLYERREPDEDAPPADGHAPEAEEDPRSLARQIGWMLRRAGSVAAVGAPLLAAAGFYAASRELLLPAIQTTGLLGAAALTQGLVREAVGAMAADGRGPRLAPVLSGAVLLALGLPVLAVIWGADWADVADIGRLAVEGFQIGATTFRPLDAAFFAAVFALVYGLTRLFQRVLRVSVLPQMGVTEGSQSALISGVGYVGVFVAGLAAISATGLDLSNLAIVAGALSVGVGFGLQTIVNNFVSGIILLVERPIKVGDWIEANMVHGVVRKVNVRSTMIETFDRSTYIIPNSQLVAQPVTNFTHSNLTGRLIVPVQVTRDADVRLVERILLELGQRHPMALRRPAAHVLFFGFGPNGTFDFELRLFLRDVNLRLTVASELRFAIVERFRAEGVVFAHPQRDVWMRGGADEGGAATPAPQAQVAAGGRP